ncbi:MAG: NADH-quinone oxidoreductase subunit N [bacterium]|nr:NADH-quinone oxidoreductase subunit N [bacterium]
MVQIPTLESLNLGVTIPAMSVAVWACLLLLIDLWIPKEQKARTAWLAAGGLVFAFIANLVTFDSGTDAFLGMFVADRFTGFMNVIILVTGVISILMSVDYLKRTGMERGEYYTLLLFTISGMMFMVGANDLITIFVALELLSIPLYVLSAFRSPDLKSEESGMKYFILGAFASAFFVYGSALVYGATGTTSLPEIFRVIGTLDMGSDTNVLLLLVGSGLVLVGLGFKVAVVPFHAWTPDVYEGAPSPITAFMSVGAKAGGFGALLRIMIVGLPSFVIIDGANAAWQQVVWVIAAATVILGNIVAILQTNIKRLLAYSSIAHAGYILMAVAAAGTAGVADAAANAALVYLLAYAFTNLGAFAVAMAIEKDDGSGTNIDDFNGLAKSRPLMAAMMTAFMLSLTGIPLTAGFMGKLFVFQATLDAGLVPLAIIGVLTSVVSALYYSRIILNMYFKEADGDAAQGATPALNWAIYAAFAGTILLGILPALATNLGGSGLFAMIP